MKKLPLFIFALLLMNGLFGSCSGHSKDASKEPQDMSFKFNHPHNIRGVRNYRRTFNDMNDKHIAIAQVIGVPPIASREEAQKMTKKLIHIKDNDFYKIDNLTHSIPYLVPTAAQLLSAIGSNFLDSLDNKGLNPNRIIVTSVLRTQNDVKKLRRRNTNAINKSAHCYGTTFDVSWRRFEKIEDPSGRPSQDVRYDTLKTVLAEVLRDLKEAKRCYVKYEIRQGCFHITARK